jgi:hypothetical protein
MGGFKEYDRYDGLGKNKLPGIRIEGNHRTRIARADPQSLEYEPHARGIERRIRRRYCRRYGDKATLLWLAAQLEKAQPWFEKRPPVFA